MWFRNLKIYRITEAWRFDSASLQEKLARHTFRGCSASEMQARRLRRVRWNGGLYVDGTNR